MEKVFICLAWFVRSVKRLEFSQKISKKSEQRDDDTITYVTHDMESHAMHMIYVCSVAGLQGEDGLQ